MAKFMRKHPDPSGTYYARLGDTDTGSVRELKIEGRNIFETDDKELIEFLQNDPEIVEVNRKTKIEFDRK